MTYLDTIAAFIKNTRFEDLPAQVIDISKKALLDYLAVTLAGTDQPVAISIQNYVRRTGGNKEAGIIGTGHRGPLSLAVLANATTGHALDFDDTNWTQIGHPTTVVAPVCLGMADQEPVSGKRWITAYALGVEILCKLAAVSMPETSRNGWHTTGVYGPFGAVCAYGSLKGMDTAPLKNGIGIAASTPGGIKAQFGSMCKPLHAGWAAQSGVVAAQLAEHGITSAGNALEGNDGFFTAYMNGSPRHEEMTLGQPWDLEKPGLAFKCYPNCSGTHPALDAIFEFLGQTPIRHDEICRIRAGVSLLSPKELIYSKPRKSTEAKFSMEYAIAGAIVFGQMGIEQFQETCVQDKRVRSLMDKITCNVDPELARLGFVGTAPVRIKIILNSGKEFNIGSDLAKGNPENPMTELEMIGKFVTCSNDFLSPSEQDQVIETVLNLEHVKNIKESGFLSILCK